MQCGERRRLNINPGVNGTRQPARSSQATQCLVTESIGVLGEKVAKHDEAEGVEVVDLVGAEPSSSSSLVCAVGQSGGLPPSRGGARARATERLAWLAAESQVQRKPTAGEDSAAGILRLLRPRRTTRSVRA